MTFLFFLLLEIAALYFYMVSSPIGVLCFVANILIVLRSKESLFYKILVLLITALPFSFIGIAGIEMLHVFSWYNVFLVWFIFVSRKYCSLSSSAAVSIMIIFICLFIATMWSADAVKSWVEICQIMVMLYPTALLFSSRSRMPLSGIQVDKLLTIYAFVALCASIGMIIQYYFYFYRGTAIGLFNFSGGGRVSCYALFRGASILPIYMGSGLMVFFMKFLDRKSLLYIISMLIMFVAMILNTSRTGIFALFAVIGFVMFTRLKGQFSISTIAISLLAVYIGTWGLDFLMESRSNLDSFTEANGREETIWNGLNIWLNSPRNFLFGEGFTGGMWDGITKTHNFVIQTLAQNGVIVASIIFCMIGRFLQSIKEKKYKYVSWFILIAGMLVTDFYANAFTSIVFILICIYDDQELSGQEETIKNLI